MQNFREIVRAVFEIAFRIDIRLTLSVNSSGWGPYPALEVKENRKCYGT